MGISRIDVNYNRLALRMFNIKKIVKLNEAELSKSEILIGDKIITFDNMSKGYAKNNAKLGDILKLWHKSNVKYGNRFIDKSGYEIKTSADNFVVTKRIFKNHENYVETSFYPRNITHTVRVKDNDYFGYTTDRTGEIIGLTGKSKGGNFYAVNKTHDGYIKSTEFFGLLCADKCVSYTVVHDKDGNLVKLIEKYSDKPDVIVE